MNEKELTYWLTLTHIQGFTTKLVNSLIKIFHHDLKISIVDFFDEINENKDNKENKEYEENEERLLKLYKLNRAQIEALKENKKKLNSNSTLVERIINYGIEMIPIISTDYPVTLKQYLKYNSPPLLYIKGNKNLLKEDAIAIVGSREPSQESLNFVDCIVKKYVQEGRVIVSGYAKGIDKYALDCALKYNGKSIIVLPQGILSFLEKNYNDKLYANIERILILSTFHPLTPWDVKLAMARNRIIYGLSEKIFIAQANEKGGTWAGAIEGLRIKNNIYIPRVSNDPKHPHNLLISKGAKSVDLNGNPINEQVLQEDVNTNQIEMPLTQSTSVHTSATEIFIQQLREFLNSQQKQPNEINNITHEISKILSNHGIILSNDLLETKIIEQNQHPYSDIVKDKLEEYKDFDSVIKEKLKEWLSKKAMSLDEIKNELQMQLNLKWSQKKLSNYLNNIDFIEKKKIDRKNKFILKSSLFDK